MDEPEYRIFSLTKMTGKESKQLRTAMFLGMEAPLRALSVCLAGGAVGAALGGMLWPLLGARAILLPFVTAAIAWWLFERRSTRGLRLRTYRAIVDSRTKDLKGAASGRLMGEFILCGQVISLDNEAPGILSKSSMPVVRNEPKPGPTTATADEDWWTA